MGFGRLAVKGERDTFRNIDPRAIPLDGQLEV